MSLCASVYMCFVVTCWERADLLALVCGVYCESVTFPLVSWVSCGTWLYRFPIFVPLLTLTAGHISKSLQEEFVSLWPLLRLASKLSLSEINFTRFSIFIYNNSNTFSQDFPISIYKKLHTTLIILTEITMYGAVYRYKWGNLVKMYLKVAKWHLTCGV